MNYKKGVVNMSVLVLAAMAIGVVILYGSTLFTQSISNGGYPAANYPLATQAANFNNTMANFTSGFINSSNAATAMPASSNPLDAVSFALQKATSVVGLVWAILNLLIAISTTGAVSLIVGGLIPAWIPGYAIFYLAALFAFAALAYLIRWFS